MNEGWLKIYRKFTDWEWYDNSEMVHLFLHLILKAAPCDKTWQGVQIRRGQAIVGRQKLSAETGISEMKIRTCMARLQESGEIEVISSNRFTIVTVCNYDVYQPVESEINQQIIQPNNQPNNQPFNQRDNQPFNHNIRSKEYNISSPTPPDGVAGEAPKKKTSNRKKPEEYTIVTKGRLVYEAFYKKMFEEDYIWSSTDAASMKKLLDKLKSSRKVKELPTDDDSVVSALPVFLESINDQWILERLSVALLVRNYNQIVKNARTNKNRVNGANRNSNQSGAEQRMREGADIVARLLAEDDAKKAAGKS